MSNALAIATVTTALAQVARAAAQGIVTGADVLTSRPDPDAAPAQRIHLFLYQVVPNASLRNNDLPTRSSDYRLVQRPRAALDLYYLLAFYGSENDLEPQRMLGAVVRDLHAHPVLTRPQIQAAVASQAFLVGSNLADSIETVRFNLHSLNLEDLSKLWSIFFQTPYTLSAVYQASLVLIETDDSAQPAPPVLQRGQDDRGVTTELGPYPVLESLHVGDLADADLRPPLPTYPAAQTGALLTLRGRNLGGESLRVRFRHPLLPEREITVQPSDRSAEQARLVLPSDAPAQDEWAAGIYTVSAFVGSGPSERETNALPLPFAARVVSFQPNPVARDGAGDASLTANLSPHLRSGQKVSLLLAGRETPAQPFADGAAQGNFVISDAPAVNGALGIVRIEGVDSLPFERQPGGLGTGPPVRLVFADNQKITIT